MKKLLAALALIVAPVCGAFASSANTLDFIGTVTGQTCEISVNGITSSPAVMLPAVPSNLVSGGSTTGLTSFTVGVNGCAASTEAFESIDSVFVGNRVTADGNLGNAGTSENVALQLVDPTVPNVPFNLGGAVGHVAAGRAGDMRRGAIAVRYVSENGRATRGSVRGSVQYLLRYR